MLPCTYMLKWTGLIIVSSYSMISANHVPASSSLMLFLIPQPSRVVVWRVCELLLIFSLTILFLVVCMLLTHTECLSRGCSMWACGDNECTVVKSPCVGDESFTGLGSDDKLTIVGV